MSGRAVWVDAAAWDPPPRPAGLPARVPLSVPAGTRLRGRLLDWRWVDRGSGQWGGVVAYTGPDGFSYQHWVPGRFLRRADDVDGGPPGVGGVARPDRRT